MSYFHLKAGKRSIFTEFNENNTYFPQTFSENMKLVRFFTRFRYLQTNPYEKAALHLRTFWELRGTNNVLHLPTKYLLCNDFFGLFSGKLHTPLVVEQRITDLMSV